jgi:thiamine-phosphate pyrophosphorylase
MEGRDRLYCSGCDSTIYENPIPATAAVVLNQQGDVLLVRRNIEPQKGNWCLPGGFVELAEKPQDCCLRELKEETNLTGEIDRPAGVFLSNNPIYKSVLVIGYSIKNVSGKMRAGDDSDEVRYFPVQNRPTMAFRSHESILNNVLQARGGSEAPSPPVRENFGLWGAYVITSGDHIELARQACLGGARILQYREKEASRKEMMKVAREIRSVTRSTGTLFIVNDFVDLALLCQADGVHLGQDDIAIGEARRLLPPGFIIGRSTHSLEQALQAQQEGADYIGIGPVFATPTKKNYPPIGLEVVKAVARRVTIPIVAIGGLDPDNIGQLSSAGISNVAMVRAFQNNTRQVVEQINRACKIIR